MTLFNQARKKGILSVYRRKNGTLQYVLNRKVCTCLSVHYGWKMHSDFCPVYRFYDEQGLKQEEVLEELLDDELDNKQPLTVMERARLIHERNSIS